MEALPWDQSIPPGWEDCLLSVGGFYPNDSQRRAIRMALTQPISFLKGPPGTGKTATILNLLSCILHLEDTLGQPVTAAMVSINNGAVREVNQRIRNMADVPGLWSQLARRTAVLGNRTLREGAEDRETGAAAGGFNQLSDSEGNAMDKYDIESRDTTEFFLKALARSIYPSLHAYYDSPEGQAEFKAWMKQQREDKKKSE